MIHPRTSSVRDSWSSVCLVPRVHLQGKAEHANLRSTTCAGAFLNNKLAMLRRAGRDTVSAQVPWVSESLGHPPRSGRCPPSNDFLYIAPDPNIPDLVSTLLLDTTSREYLRAIEQIDAVVPMS